MGTLTRLGIAVVVIGVGTPAAHAEDPKFEAGLFFGGDLFGDNIELGNSFYDDQVPGASPLFGLRGQLRFLKRFGVEIEGKLAPSSTDGADGRPSISTTVLGYRAHAMVFHALAPKLEVFGLIGAGLETAMFDSPPDALAIDTPDTDGSVHWGIGGLYGFGDGRYGARLDLRQALTAGRDPSLTLAHEVHLGVYFRFGGQAGTVVVERIVEKPVDRPVDRPSETDSDGDGIPDALDKCPNQAEVMNDIDDDDGCPEVDSDNDGLLGSRDKCPAAAEDLDGFQDDDGCPDLDNDGDGRPDRIDACPNEPENLNGFEDDDGCPDEIPDKVIKFTGVIKGIRFKKGSARILSSSHKTLNQAVEIFKEYPSLRIEISGHTDDRGGDKINITLSRKRADYVKWYLVDKGIEPDRVITIGLGPEKPIADNDSRKGRAQNRRIEFKLLPGPATIDVDADGNPVGAGGDGGAGGEGGEGGGEGGGDDDKPE
jgi:OOP family OmpA-OmpF porin